MLGAGLAIAVAPTTAASAAPLCLTNDVVTTVTVVLPTAKLKKAKVKPLVGQVVGAGAAMPLSGLSIVSADGMSLVIAVEAPRVNVASGGGGGLTQLDTIFRALFLEADGRLDVGDTSSQGLVQGLAATYTVVDCDTAPAFP
jgi:hypothetical protein